MATALGTRYLQRWSAGTVQLKYMDAALQLGWITQAEYDDALVTYPPSDPNDPNSYYVPAQ